MLITRRSSVVGSIWASNSVEFEDRLREQDLNPRHPTYEAGALAWLSYTEIVGVAGEIRTLTVPGLNRLPLPLG